jgi:hypothetical protein
MKRSMKLYRMAERAGEANEFYRSVNEEAAIHSLGVKRRFGGEHRA